MIELGDAKNRDTRPGDVIRDLVSASAASASENLGKTFDDPLTDTWVELVRGGTIPAQTGNDETGGRGARSRLHSRR